MNRCREILARHTWNIEVSCLLVMVVDSASTVSCRGDSLSLVSSVTLLEYCTQCLCART